MIHPKISFNNTSPPLLGPSLPPAIFHDELPSDLPRTHIVQLFHVAQFAHPQSFLTVFQGCPRIEFHLYQKEVSARAGKR